MTRLAPITIFQEVWDNFNETIKNSWASLSFYKANLPLQFEYMESLGVNGNNKQYKNDK